MVRICHLIGIVGFVAFGLMLLALLAVSAVANAQTQQVQYVISEWVWDESEQTWMLPECAFSGFDLRTVPKMSTRGGEPGYGLFTLDRSCATPENAIELGDSLNSPLSPDAVTAIESVLKREVAGETATDMLWHMVTDGSDVTGQNGIRPIIPNDDLEMNLYVGGTRIKSESFSVTNHLFVLEALQFNYETARQTAERNQDSSHRKLAGYWQEKYGFDVRNSEQKSDGITEPETTTSEDFECSDSTASIDCELNWVELSVTGDGWQLVNGRASNEEINTILASADTVFSGVDMASTTLGAASVGSTTWVGSFVRSDNSTDTGYFGGHRNASSNTYTLRKVINGTFTTVANEDASAPGVGFIENTLTVEGTDLTLESDSVERITTTDSSIDGSTVGGVHAGIWGEAAGANRALIESFNANDEVGPTPTPTPTPTATPTATPEPTNGGGGLTIQESGAISFLWLLAALGFCIVAVISRATIFYLIGGIFLIVFAIEIDTFFTWMASVSAFIVLMFMSGVIERGNN